MAPHLQAVQAFINVMQNHLVAMNFYINGQMEAPELVGLFVVVLVRRGVEIVGIEMAKIIGTLLVVIIHLVDMK